MNREKFKQWLNKCPVKYDEIPVTSDYDILTINFHGKDIQKSLDEERPLDDLKSLILFVRKCFKEHNEE